jgi:hypothetical protein
MEAELRMSRGRRWRCASPDGNAATSVVWNPVRKLFVAAVRFHGYYQSADGSDLDADDGAAGPGI